MTRPRTNGRPSAPEGYGIEDAVVFLEWEVVEARLREATHYWLATSRPDGRPHVVPRWGVWLDNRFWYDGSRRTRHALNAARNPHCALHLEDGAAATMLEGVTEPSMPVAGSLGERLSAEFVRKYARLGYAPGPESWADGDAGGLSVFTPEVALAWTSFVLDPTRFRFD